MNKKMLIYIVVMFSCFFVFSTEVRAASATCKYNTNGGVFTIVADNNSVRTSYKQNASATFQSQGSTSGIKYEHFYADNEKCNLKCPILYLETIGSGRSTTYELKGSKKGVVSEVSPESSSVINNNDCSGNNSTSVENDSSGNNTGDSDTIMAVCNYNVGGGKYIVTASNNTVSTTFTSSISGVSGDSDEFRYNLFYADDKKCNLKCPTLYYKVVGTGRGASYSLHNSKNEGTAISPSGDSTVINGACPESPSGSGDNNVDITTGDPMTCDSLKNTATYNIVKQVFKWVQIIAPIMLVIFGVIDFATPVISGDNDAMKKAQSKFIKRVIIVAAIILLPLIIDLLISLLDGAMGNNVGTCEINK